MYTSYRNAYFAIKLHDQSFISLIFNAQIIIYKLVGLCFVKLINTQIKADFAIQRSHFKTMLLDEILQNISK